VQCPGKGALTRAFTEPEHCAQVHNLPSKLPSVFTVLLTTLLAEESLAPAHSGRMAQQVAIKYFPGEETPLGLLPSGEDWPGRGPASFSFPEKAPGGIGSSATFVTVIKSTPGAAHHSPSQSLAVPRSPSQSLGSHAVGLRKLKPDRKRDQQGSGRSRQFLHSAAPASNLFIGRLRVRIPCKSFPGTVRV
jgi:hypothetical protein